ncbi:MAG: type I-F CRISPR-associated protein Csy2 [Wenzhouxiangella sp.]|nr:MAG: type I-F CRISPR-associated protein Csy2 [Wenzhouxiangella sp.]
MSECPDFTHLLCLPRLRVQNANAVSSPLTHGFPAMTAFLGLMWALERKAHAAGIEVFFNAVGVICHEHQELITDTGFVKAFRLTRNPIDKTGKTAAIVEEGRMHVEISLLLGITAEHWRDTEREREETSAIAAILHSMRVAGGTLHPPEKPGLRRYRPWTIPQSGSDAAAVFKKARGRLLPGSALVLREDLIGKRQKALQQSNPDCSRLEAWLSLSRFNWRYQEDDSGKGEWVNDRPKGSGWIVPIPIGYGALSELHPAGSVTNARDANTPFRFVESLYSVGEWLGPHRIQEAKQMLWYSESDPESGAYRCRNDYRSQPDQVGQLSID